MKKIYMKACLLLLLLSPLFSQGQLVVQIGTATTTTSTSGPTLLTTFWHDRIGQMIFTASELNAAGINAGFISALEFNFTALGPVNPTNFNVSIGTTTTAPPITGFVPQANLTSVYSGNPTITVGWNVFSFTTPFFWNGTDNLIVQTCHDNSTYISPSYTTEYTATSVNTIYYYYNDGVVNSCNPANWTSPITGASTNRANTRFHYLPPYANDAGITAIDSPMIPACSLTQNVWVTLANSGTAPLTSATINWTVNGLSQGPVSWTGNLAPYNTLDSVFVGTYGFSNNDVLKVWTSLPNGVADSLPNNDTITKPLYTSLAGNYSIGGIGADYPTFTAAVTDLNNRGVCAAVTFNVANGTYTERLTINEVLGASSVNTITFQSVTGDSTQVTLTEGGISSANHIIRFNGADYITFKGMTIENTNASYGRVLVYENGASFNSIQNSRLETTVGTSTGTGMAVVTGNGLNNDNSFQNNRITGGSYSFYWYGLGSAPTGRSENLLIDGNVMEDAYYQTMRLYYTKGGMVNNNLVNMPAGQSGSALIYWYYDNGSYQINNNRLNGRLTGTGINYALYLNYLEAPASSRASITNNYIVSGDVGVNMYHYGLQSYYCTNFDFLHNSLNLLGNSTNTTYAMYFYYGGGMRVLNNNVVNTGGGSYGAIYWIQSFILEMDHNNYHAPNATGIGYYNALIPTLADWQSATGFDLNSLTVNPNYLTRTELKPCNDTLDSKGKYVGIMSDLEGDYRSSTVPDIGADEFIAGLPDLGPDTSVCAGVPLTLSMSGATGQTYDWNTTETTPEITVTFPSTYYVDVTSHCGIVGSDTIVVTHISNPIANFTTTTSYLSGIFTNQSLSGNDYFWDFGDGATSTDANPTHAFANSGSHNVTLYVTNECGTDSITIQIILSVPGFMEHGDGVQASIYPNPGNGDMMVVMNGMIGSVQVSVIDLEGRILHTEQHQLNGSEYSTRMDMRAGLAQGIYLVRIDSMEGSVVQKLIVQ